MGRLKSLISVMISFIEAPFKVYLNSGVFTGVFQYSTGGGKSIVRFLYETNNCDRMRNQKHEDGDRNGYKRND